MSRNRSRQSLNKPQAVPDADRRGNSQASQTYSRAEQLSRTPSADRQLLRALTVTPEQDDEQPTPYHPPPVLPTETDRNTTTRQSGQVVNNIDTPARQSSQAMNNADNNTLGDNNSWQTAQPNTARSPTVTYEETPARTATYRGSTQYKDQPSRVSTVASRSVINIPTPKPENSRTEDWQANKTVAESNNHMLKYEIACDVTFAVGEGKEEIRSHKYMLMARSPVLFKSLIRHLGNMDVKIGVPDIKPETFKEMLQYMYTDEFDIHADNVTSVLFAAKKFQLKGLSNMCFEYLAAEMRDDTAAKVMEQAHIYNESNLYSKCQRFIFANGNDVLRSPSIGQLCAECLEKILASDDLRASEEAVFEGSILWANAECRRQRLQPTDEARRNVLGKMLYLIRFPIMGVTYFTQKVSLGDLLSHDEKLSIFQYYHGEEQQLPQRFSRTERKGLPKNDTTRNTEPFTLNDTSSRLKNTWKVKRARRFHTCDGQWKQNGPPDAISFTVSQPIELYGVEIFGACGRTETYTVDLYLYDDIGRKPIQTNRESIYTSPKKDTYDVFLSMSMRIPAKRTFTVVVALNGHPTHKGVDGEAIITTNGVTFEFCPSNKSSNGTDVTIGQISGLLYNRTQ